MTKHSDRIKSIASGANGAHLILKTNGGETVVCSAPLIAVETGGKLPALGADVGLYRWAEVPKGEQGEAA